MTLTALKPSIYIYNIRVGTMSLLESTPANYEYRHPLANHQRTQDYSNSGSEVQAPAKESIPR